MKLDALTVLTVMGMATERLGLGATYSTSYYEPFHVARLFATLDLMTQGRAAWNVVTSLNDGEAQNMGRDEVIAQQGEIGHDHVVVLTHGFWQRTFAGRDDVIGTDLRLGGERYAIVGVLPPGFDFLGLAPFDAVYEVHNARSYPAIESDLAAYLGDKFAASNDRLVELLGPDFDFRRG